MLMQITLDNPCLLCLLRADNAGARRHLISNALSLIHMTKGKNILLSSEAEKVLQMRGPYDVINL